MARDVPPGADSVLSCDKHPGGPRLYFSRWGCRGCAADEAARVRAGTQRNQPLAELVEEYTKLTTRATERARNAAASIDRVLCAMPSIDLALSADEAERMRQYNQQAHDRVTQAFFDSMAAPKPTLEVVK